MANPIDVCNMALGHIGISKTITSLTEDSNEARACNRFYQNTFEIAMTECQWPFSRRFKTLSLVEEDPTTEWAFSYRYPNDSLLVRRIFSGLRNDSDDTKIPYLIGSDSSGLLLYCDVDEAEIEYTHKSDNGGIWPADFVMAHSLLLATFIAPQLAKGDPSKLRTSSYELYQKFIGQAIAGNMSEEKPDREPVDSFTRSRA